MALTTYCRAQAQTTIPFFACTYSDIVPRMPAAFDV